MKNEEGPRKSRRVLLVPSSYVPTMIADMQRVRMLAWDLPTLGWDVEVLFPGSQLQHPSCIDVDSSPFFSSTAVIHSAEPSFAWIFRTLQMRSIGWRALWPLYFKGREVLRKSKFDLIYLSTTSFPLFVLGRLWQKEFGVSYVLDFHDPWVKEGNTYQTTPHVVKARISGWLSHFLERFAVGAAEGIVAVSPKYISALSKRYGAKLMPWQKAGRSETIPFGVSLRDLSLAGGVQLLDADASKPREIAIHYVGAGGGIMEKSFSLICSVLASLRKRMAPLVDRVRVRLYGTTFGWKEGDRCFLQEVAAQCGVSDLVTEYPARVSYLKSLEILLEADGVFILGVDDLGYMPSKLFSYAASGKPLLASLRHQSTAHEEFLREPKLGHVLWFSENCEMMFEEACKTMERFLTEAGSRQTFDRNEVICYRTSVEMARKHAALFDRICTSRVV